MTGEQEKSMQSPTGADNMENEYERNLANFRERISKTLESISITPLQIQSRVKKLEREDNSLPHDFYAFRYIFSNKTQCYMASIALINSFNVLRLKDYYVNHHPQEPTYRAIHLDLQIDGEKHIEVQIKTLRMHNKQMLKRKLLGDHYWKDNNS